MRRFIALLLLLFAPSLFARVVRVDITQRTAAGPYEKLSGRVYFAVDPNNVHNKAIVDLDRAARNANGEVEFSSDVEIIRPANFDAMWVEIANRGGRSILNPQRDDFLLRHGFAVASVGWQFDVRPDPNLIRLYAPTATGITGKVRADFVVTEKRVEHPVGHVIQGQIGGTGYPVADVNERGATLTERDTQTAPRRTIPRTQWRFSDANTIHYDAAFVPNKIYEIIYTAKDPAVVGTGFAAVRDFVSYVKHDVNAVAKAKYVYGFGISQSGRFLRHMLYQGFNADENGQQVFDGTMPVVAGAGRGGFNHRFAQPSRDAQPVSPLFYPVDIPPYTDNELLERAAAEKVVPKIIYINTSYEFWSRGESLTYTSPDGTREVDLPSNVRLYTVAGMGHIGGPWPPEKGEGQNLRNSTNYFPVVHAMFLALDQWVRGASEPPPSVYPHLDQLTRSVSITTLQPYQPYKIDSSTEPPRVLGTYVALVPQIDADGNELGSLRLPNVAVPLATWTGWNARDPKIGFPNERASFIGSYIPFSKERIAQLYRDKSDYLGRVTNATLSLLKGGYLVSDDVAQLIQRASEEWDYALK